MDESHLSNTRRNVTHAGALGMLFLIWGFAPAILAATMEALHLPGGSAGLRFQVVILIIVSVTSQYLWSRQLLSRLESPRANQTRWVFLIAMLGLLVNAALFYAGCSYLYARAFEGLRPGV